MIPLQKTKAHIRLAILLSAVASLFGFTETIYFIGLFGWHLLPSCPLELILDGITLLIFYFAYRHYKKAMRILDILNI